jgi:hypothetical protein
LISELKYEHVNTTFPSWFVFCISAKKCQRYKSARNLRIISGAFGRGGVSGFDACGFDSAFWLGLLFDHEDGSDMFLRIIR